jgi:hypothetical protein
VTDRDIRIEVEVFGDEAAARDVDAVSRNIRHPDWEYAMVAYEHAEARHFAGPLHGHLIRTGRLLRSLTESHGADAIREAHGETAHFGTRVPYARAAAHKAGHYVLVIDDLGQREFTKRLADRQMDIHRSRIREVEA